MIQTIHGLTSFVQYSIRDSHFIIKVMAVYHLIMAITTITTMDNGILALATIVALIQTDFCHHAKRIIILAQVTEDISKQSDILNCQWICSEPPTNCNWFPIPIKFVNIVNKTKQKTKITFSFSMARHLAVNLRMKLYNHTFPVNHVPFLNQNTVDS